MSRSEFAWSVRTGTKALVISLFVVQWVVMGRIALDLYELSWQHQGLMLGLHAAKLHEASGSRAAVMRSWQRTVDAWVLSNIGPASGPYPVDGTRGRDLQNDCWAACTKNLDVANSTEAAGCREVCWRSGSTEVVATSRNETDGRGVECGLAPGQRAACLYAAPHSAHSFR